jgi:hypothetical protein
MKKYDATEIVLATLIAIGIFLLLALFEAWIGVALWGAIAVKIFGLPTLTFWQFYGLMILLHILLPSRGASIKEKN